ncbi:hypothetical protein [Leifsonia sp. Leaf264]|uniref:hypothetical protein n=1 Tax=Leifsonia sp. Leaf264 TaxID=1736314 RepID=UPI0006FA2D11|nr:hypothetical protein [Leifsonia sp. Leaf264]KQO98674.1 hypothetical protein ASF30_11470 [Leifsonia sp. Leaf264]
MPESTLTRYKNVGLVGNGGWIAPKEHQGASAQVIDGIVAAPAYPFNVLEYETVGDAIARTVRTYTGKDGVKETVNTFYSDAVDGLTTDQMDAILRGEVADVREEMKERLAKAHRAAAEQEAEDITRKLGADWRSMDDDDRNEIVEAVMEVDRHDAVGILTHMTEKQLFRLPLGKTIVEQAAGTGITGIEFFDEANADAQAAARRQVLLGIFAEHGADPEHPETVEAARRLVEDGPKDWSELTVDVAWNGTLHEARIPSDEFGRTNPDGREFEFVGVTVIIHDPYDGETVDAVLPTLKARATDRNPVTVDTPDKPGSWSAQSGRQHRGLTPDEFRASAPGGTY